MPYLIGRRLRLRVNVKEVDSGELIDPENLHLRIRHYSSDTIEEYTYPTDPQIIKEDVGIYYMDTTPDAPGTYGYRWWSTGEVEDANEETFIIADTRVEGES